MKAKPTFCIRQYRILFSREIPTFLTQPVFQGEYPGWNLEPGFLPGSYGLQERQRG
jgi:hypothetical protein